MDSLLPILAERALPPNTKNTITTIAVPQRSQQPIDISPPALMPKLQTSRPLPVVPYRATPMEPQLSISDYCSEPISLEMINRAATDLNKKGVINIKKYQKYLHKSQ